MYSIITITITIRVEIYHWQMSAYGVQNLSGRYSRTPVSCLIKVNHSDHPNLEENRVLLEYLHLKVKKLTFWVHRSPFWISLETLGSSINFPRMFCHVRVWQVTRKELLETIETLGTYNRSAPESKSNPLGTFVSCAKYVISKRLEWSWK